MEECWVWTRFLQDNLDTNLFKIVRDQAWLKRLIHNAYKPKGDDSKNFFEQSGRKNIKFTNSEINVGHSVDQIPKANGGKVIKQHGGGRGEGSDEGTVEVRVQSLCQIKPFHDLK